MTISRRDLPIHCGRIAGVFAIPHVAPRKSQSRAARRSHPPEPARADPRRSGERQDARAHHPHCVADPDRQRQPGRRARGDIHEQGRARDAHAHLGDAPDQHARHVGRDVPRAVQPHAARASSRSGIAAALPDPRHAGPAIAREAGAAGHEHRRGQVPATPGAVVHQWSQGRGHASEGCGGLRRHLAPHGRDLHGVRRAMPARRARGLSGAAAALVRAADAQRGPARALPEPIPARAGRRVSGHQPPSVPVAQAAGRPAHSDLRCR